MEHLQRIEEEKEKRTGTLYLGDCGLREWPEEVFEMDWLEELIMSDMTLDKDGKLVYSSISYFKTPNILNKLPPSIGNLKKLKCLYLSGSHRYKWSINSLEPLSELVELTFLHCQFNKITKIEKLDQLINLNSIDLSYNSISKIENLDKLINLNSVFLRSNSISKIENLDKLINLNSVNLSNNSISKIENLDKLTNLNSIYLRSNSISKIENLDKLINLNSIDLRSNSISKIENLDKLINLNSIDLSSNSISKIENLDKLINLNSVYLSSNPISKIENLDKLINLNSVYLNSNSISKIENLDKLINLNSIDLRSNSISKIENLDKLINLNSVYLSSNSISKIENLDKLINLNSIDLRSNSISKIENLDKLINLNSVYLNSNSISKIENLDKLINLNSVYLNSNSISKIENLDKLINLNSIDLHNNSISKIENLDSFNLDCAFTILNNPIEGFPHGLLGRYANDHFIRDYRNWVSELGENPPKNTFTKILITGNGNVGKSSLITALKEGRCEKSPDSTHGIELSTWGYEGQNYHIWDFGGQEIFHGTHKMFFIGQAIQIIVFDHDSENELEADDRVNTHEKTRNQPMKYWVHQAEQEGNDSPIIIVQNKADQRDDVHPKVYSLSGEKKYPYVCLSAKEGTSLDELVFHIQKKTKQLYEYNMPIPPTWATVRDHLLQKQKKVTNRQLTMEKSAFFEECMEYGVNENVLPTLLTFLHNSGFLYYNEAHLGNTLIIDQKWALEGIYKALDRKSLFYRLMRNHLNGFIDIVHLYREWDDYDSGQKTILLGFMKSCGICTPVNKHSNASNEYLFPEFLNEEKSESVVLLEEKYATDLVTFRCSEAFFPSALLHHFIIEYFQYADKSNVWKNGILFKVDNGIFILEIDFIKNILSIKLTNEEVKKWLPKMVQDLDLYDSKHLWQQYNAKDDSYDSFDITQYRELAEEANYKLSEVPKKDALNIAISYAKEDAELEYYGYNALDEIRSSFAGLIRDKKVNIFSDKDIEENDWDSKIRLEFQEADLIIILNSQNYNRLEKQYIWEVEMPIIAKKYKEDKISVYRLDICEVKTTKPIHSISRFGKTTIPDTKVKRAKYFKDFIEQIVEGVVMKNLGLL